MAKSRGGQVTAFIILGIVIVTAIILMFLFFGKTGLNVGREVSPRYELEKCLRDSVEPAVDKILENGGVLDSEFFKLYKDEKYNYLCYQENFYQTCVNHYPQLKSLVEEQIREDSVSRAEQCFEQFKTEFESQGFDVSVGVLDYEVILEPGRVFIDTKRNIDLVKEDDSQTFDEFDNYYTSPLYGLVDVAREIVNQEAEYCNFDYNGFMLLYPEFDIDRVLYDKTRIYRITDRASGRMFKFAVRSCAYREGI